MLPTAEEARAILEDRNAALIRQQTGKDPSRLTEPEYREALQDAYDRAIVDPASCYEDGRFIPGRFAQVLLDRGYTFATLEDTEEVLVYEPARGLYVPGESRVKALLQRTIGEQTRTHWANETVGHIQRSTYVSRESFNPPGALCLENGVLDLESRMLRDHAAEPRYTRHLPVVFDPGATCPAFLQFLEEVQPAEDAREIVQLVFGYCLAPGNWLQRAFMFTGGGNNGKSTLEGVLKDLLGPDNVAAMTLQALSDNRFATASLYGKLANIVADLPNAPVRHTGIFKALTGGDLITGERKFQEPFTFVNEAVLLFSANELPTVDDRTYAFWRRWVLLPFPVDFTGREDRELPGKLRAELPGILNWALDGLHKLRELGDFPVEGTAGGLMETWKRRSDSLYWFVQEQVERDPEGFVPKEVFYEVYRAFCEEHDLRPKTKDLVGKQLADYIPQIRTARGPKVDGKRPWGWNGVARRLGNPGHPGHPGHPGVNQAHLSNLSGLSRVSPPKGRLDPAGGG